MKNIGKGLKNCFGIYLITCTGNNQCYVGSSVNIQERWQQHLALLRSNKHTSNYLQHSYNKYGEDSLRFKVLAELPPVSEEELRDTEWFFIELYKPQFNSAAPVVYNRTDEWKSKISETTKKLYTEKGYVNPRKGAGKRYKMFIPSGESLYHNLTLPEVCDILGNKDYHSINNSLRRFNIAVSKDKKYLTVPEDQSIDETMQFLHNYACTSKLGLDLVDSNGELQHHGFILKKKLKEQIINSNNRYTFYNNELITLSFMPLYVVTHIDNTPEYPRNLNAERCMAT